ncbi:hypothetical protein ACFQDF_24020 [Ectobacillus funiculus]
MRLFNSTYIAFFQDLSKQLVFGLYDAQKSNDIIFAPISVALGKKSNQIQVADVLRVDAFKRQLNAELESYHHRHGRMQLRNLSVYIKKLSLKSNPYKNILIY